MRKTKLTAERLSQDKNELKSILGIEDKDFEESDLPFSDSANSDPIESYFEDPEDEDEKEPEREQQEDVKAEDDDAPSWVKVMQSKIDATESQNRALQEELRMNRMYDQQERQRQAQEQQKREQFQQRQQEDEEEAYWIDSRILNQQRQEIDQQRQQDMRMVHQVAVNQEWQNFNYAVSALEKEVAADPNTPPLWDVLKKENVMGAFKLFAQNPGAVGGFGQNWLQHLRLTYQQQSYPVMLRKAQEQAAKDNELAKKREEKQKSKQQDLAKVAKGGSPNQEPRNTNKWVSERRPYRSAAVRGQALKILEGE